MLVGARPEWTGNLDQPHLHSDAVPHLLETGWNASRIGPALGTPHDVVEPKRNSVAVVSVEVGIRHVPGRPLSRATHDVRMVSCPGRPDTDRVTQRHKHQTGDDHTCDALCRPFHAASRDSLLAFDGLSLAGHSASLWHLRQPTRVKPARLVFQRCQPGVRMQARVRDNTCLGGSRTFTPSVSYRRDLTYIEARLAGCGTLSRVVATFRAGIWVDRHVDSPSWTKPPMDCCRHDLCVHLLEDSAK